MSRKRRSKWEKRQLGIARAARQRQQGQHVAMNAPGAAEAADSERGAQRHAEQAVEKAAEQAAVARVAEVSLAPGGPDGVPSADAAGTNDAQSAAHSAAHSDGASQERSAGDVHDAEGALATEASLGSGVRGIKRTRTLADVVQPARPAQRRASGDEWPELERVAAIHDMQPVSLGDTMPTIPGVRPPRDRLVNLTTPLRRQRSAPETRPIGADALQATLPPSRTSAARRTKRLADADEQAAAPREDASADAKTPVSSEPIVGIDKRGRLDRSALIAHVALAHASVALIGAVSASALLVRGDAFGWWLLGAAVLALPGAAFASLPTRRALLSVPWGGIVLVVSQLGMLAWALLVLGQRVELVALVPAGIWLAYRLGGLALASGAACGAAALVLASIWTASQALTQPVLVLNAAGSNVATVTMSVLGLGLVLWTVASSERARVRSDMAALARRSEAGALLKQASLARSRLERDAELLAETLAAALHGKGVRQLTIDGPLGPVAEMANVVAERLRTLQKDREDRIRLEGALCMVISAVERAWIGLPWHWPAVSGTAVDELITLLRTPRPHEREREASDDFPTLVPLPNLACSGGYWRGPLLPQEQSMPNCPGASSPGVAQGRFGWDDLLGGR